VVKIDINNEVLFLKQLEKTPSFVIYQKKGNYFWDLDLKLSQELSEEERKKYNEIKKTLQVDSMSKPEEQSETDKYLQEVIEWRSTDFINVLQRLKK
jgi:hypothetical protein